MGPQLATVNAGTVRVVKTVICNLLMVWLTLMSVGANAHATDDAAHKTFYTHDHSAQEKQHHVAALDTASSVEVSHTDTCNHSHCGHSHAAGLLGQESASGKTDTVTKVPADRASWATSHIVNNIERPKWPVTTPAVVNLLS